MQRGAESADLSGTLQRTAGTGDFCASLVTHPNGPAGFTNLQRCGLKAEETKLKIILDT
tara:strand:- start:523 stop:699 length:177 start_codon:yes stop_codon:yes gene_type:complete